MKILVKILMTLILFFYFISIVNSVTHAATYSEMVQDAQSFIQKGESESGDLSDGISDITAEFLPLGQILTTVGAGVLVAVTTYMGIKYIMSGPEAQAKLKQQLIGVIVSGGVIFGAYGIWRLVGGIVKNF